MRCKDLTLFDLGTAGDYVVVAGGGGNEAYGKKNGVLIVNKEDIDAQAGERGVFYRTEDLIKDVQVYAEGAHYTDFGADECSLGESSIFEGNDASEQKEDGGDNPAGPRAESSRGVVYVVATGDDCLYMLRFDGAFRLLARGSFQAAQVYFRRHLVVLVDGTVYGFYDPASSPGSLRLHSKKSSPADSHEEYFYKVYRRNNRLIYKREGGTVDVPDGWSRFFIHQDKIHKVIYAGGVSTFVFNSKKYSYEGEISRIQASAGMLVFYIVHARNAHLYFIAEEEKVFQLPKITCLCMDGSTAIVATCTGDAIVYVSGVYYSKMQLASVPITGLALSAGYAYFTLINGEIGRVKIRRIRYSLGFVLALIVLLLAILYRMYKK